MSTRDELLKAFANQLATLAVTEDASRALALLRLTTLSAEPSGKAREAAAKSRRQEAPDSPGRPERVGIWERKPGSYHFVRRGGESTGWHAWANVGRLEPKAGRRVVLIGESAARGYLYDPQYTPAKALERVLRTRPETSGLDVVDLACTGMSLGAMRRTATEALLLEPDVVVVFAGNNWRVSWTGAGIAQAATAVRESGIAGLTRLLRDTLEETAADHVRAVTELYRARGVRLIWVVPEFNLGDWRDPVLPAPHLPDGSNAEWFQEWSRGEQALRDGAIATAASHARRLIDLDGGVSVAGYYLLAACSLRGGADDVARDALEAARDALAWSPFMQAPRAHAVTQRILRQQSAGDAAVVDLPRIFREHVREGLPDRRLFLDYCHLNADGLQIATAAMAAAVLQVLTGTTVPWRTLVPHVPRPTPRVEAEGAFLAAVHNAHWHQGYEPIRSYCDAALRLSSDMAQVMTSFVDVQTRRCPTLVSRAAAELSARQFPSIQHYLLRTNRQQLDGLLLDAIADALTQAGVDVRPHRDALRIAEHSASRGRVDLLDPYYLTSAQPAFAQPTVVDEPRFAAMRGEHIKAIAPESRFVFVGEAGRSVSLTLTCRVPSGTSSPGAVRVELNGAPLATARVSARWESLAITIDGASVRDGLNAVSVHWPVTPELLSRPGALDRAADDIVAGFLPELHPVFGEIHAFTGAGVSEPYDLEVDRAGTTGAACP